MSDTEVVYNALGTLIDLNISYYPSGEPIIVARHWVNSILLRPKSINTFLATMFWIDALEARGNDKINLILPFAPGARQDRLNDQGDALFTAKSIAKIINNSHIKSVTLLDPHSDVFPALLNAEVNIVHIDKCIQSHSQGLTHIIAPDAGARKRAELIGKYFKLPVIQAWKTRDIATGAITGFGIEPFETKGRVLVVDDICDGGGTFIGLADILDKMDIRAELFVTHGIFSKGTQPLLDRYGKVFCTDSVIGDKTGVEVNNMCEQLLRRT